MSDINRIIVANNSNLLDTDYYTFRISPMYPILKLELPTIGVKSGYEAYGIVDAIIQFTDGSYGHSSGPDIFTFVNLRDEDNEESWYHDFGALSSANRLTSAKYNSKYDSIVVSSYSGSDGNIISFNRSNGAILWSVTLGSFAYHCSIDEDGNVYVPSGTSLFKLNGETGAVIWTEILPCAIFGSDAGSIGGINGVVVCGGTEGILEFGDNVFVYDSNGNLIWSKYIPSFVYDVDPMYSYNYPIYCCRIYGNSQDILVNAISSYPGIRYNLRRLNGGNGSIIWQINSEDTLEIYTAFGDKYNCIEYDDQGNIWYCYVAGYIPAPYAAPNVSGRIAKISPSGAVINSYQVGPEFESGTYAGEVCPHVTIQAYKVNPILMEETTTTPEPWPCEVSNLFEYGYVEKDGIRILIRKTEGNELKLIQPIPPEWTVGTVLKLVPGCNKTLCDCANKWNNEINFLALGVKMPTANPLTSDLGANPG